MANRMFWPNATAETHTLLAVLQIIYGVVLFTGYPHIAATLLELWLEQESHKATGIK